MLDTMTLTKAVGALCGALLIYLLGKWAGEELYAMGGGHGADDGPAYVIEVASADDAPAEEVEEVPFEVVYASADADAGENIWRRCAACHKLEAGANGTGPYLLGVVGRDIGSVDGFNYSGALSQVGDVWTPENLNTFLISPGQAAPGTSMNFRGLAKPEDRANLIAYLATQTY